MQGSIGRLTLISLKPKWTIIQAVGKCVYIYIYYITRKFYNMLSQVRAREIQWYFSINNCDLSTKSYLPGASIYFPFTVTNFKVAVCHFVQDKVSDISLISFSTISSTFLRKKYPSTCSVEWIDILSDTNYNMSHKRTGCDPAAIHFRNKQVIYYHNQSSNIFSLFGWINLASARSITRICGGNWFSIFIKGRI